MARFVGRLDDLAALCEITGAAAEGDVAAALVVGDPGTGKSRLLAEAAARARLSGCFSVVGYEPERHVPLAAAADLLRALGETSSAGSPLDARVFGAHSPQSTLEPVRVFEAAHRALAVVGPALVVVDDLQWVDELSMALCHYLVRAAEASGPPLALVAVGRPSPDAASFAVALGKLLPAARLRSLELGPLASDEALELVKVLAPGLPERAARELAERSGGSPFWLEVLVRSAGAEVDAADLVTARLRGASADAGALLALLAIAARPLALADAVELNGWEARRARPAANELLARGIAVESGGTVRLAHDLIRAAAYGEIPDERRREVHRRVGDWLARVAGADVRRLREALGHTHAAGSPSLDLACRLVRSSRRTLLGDEGLALLVSIAEASDPFDGTALALNEGIAALASELARHDVALERTLLVAERRTEPSVRARALLEAARSAYALNDGAGARALLARARAIDCDDELLDLELDTQHAVLELWGDGRKELGRALAHDAADRARRRFQTDATARGAYLEALRVEYEAAFQEDDLDGMVRAAEDRAAAARGFDDESYLTAVIAGTRALRRAGRLDESLQRVRYVWEESRRRVLPRLTLDAGYWLGRSCSDAAGSSKRKRSSPRRPSWPLAWETRPAPATRSIASPARSSSTAAIGGRAWSAYSRRRKARASTPGSIFIRRRRCGSRWRAARRLRKASSTKCGRRGRAPTTRAARGARPNCDSWSRTRWRTSVAALRRRSRSTSGRGCSRILNRATGSSDARVQALLQAPASTELLEAALRDAGELDFVLDALWTRIDLGLALAPIDRARAKEVLGAAADVAAELGANTAQQVAQQRLRALGVRTWRRGPAAEPLTEREQSVARLIAAGSSNAEIAQQLFVSRKTVERHVSNVLRKVGVRNRAELAARVAEHEVEGVHR